MIKKTWNIRCLKALFALRGRDYVAKCLKMKPLSFSNWIKDEYVPEKYREHLAAMSYGKFSPQDFADTREDI